MYGLVTWLCQPYTLLLTATLLLMVRLWRRNVPARVHLRWLALCWLLLVIISTPAAAYLAIKGLESSFPPAAAARGSNDVMIVLTGSVESADAVRPWPELGDSSLYRCIEAAKLYSSGPRCKIVVAGGKVNPAMPGAYCSHVMRDLLRKLGVAAADLIVEDRSRSTYESAVECRELFENRSPQNIFLVTEATHLRRAVACFRAQGMDVIADGCHYQATHFNWSVHSFLPNTSALKKTHTALHEWTGLAWYWLRGRI